MSARSSTGSVRARVEAARARLVRAGVDADAAVTDAEVLARHLLGWSRAQLLAHGDDRAPASFPNRFETLVERRARREPVSLILGQREFWGLDFEVTPDVLTPRPETEILVAEAVATLERSTSAVEEPHVVDVGTGSGCIAVSLATEQPAMRVTAIDPSEAALAVARRNAERHGVAGRIDWHHARYLQSVTRPADAIVANLPYIADPELDGLPPEVREFEPRSALAGGPDGLDAIRRLIDDAASHLTASGSLLLEIGHDQLDGVRAHARTVAELEITTVRSDLQGIPRVIALKRMETATS